MPTDSKSPYLPPSDIEGLESIRKPAGRFRGSAISAGACVFAGLTFVVSMAIADYDTETIILFAATLLLLAMALPVLCLPLRIIAPMYVLVPFLIVVAGRHVGDMGPTHYIDGGIYLMGCLAFFVALTAATVAKTAAWAYQVKR